MTDAFIDSQVEYYRRHLRCGHPRDWNQIAGLLHYYEGLQHARRKPLASKRTELGIQAPQTSRDT